MCFLVMFPDSLVLQCFTDAYETVGPATVTAPDPKRTKLLTSRFLVTTGIDLNNEDVCAKKLCSLLGSVAQDLEVQMNKEICTCKST